MPTRHSHALVHVIGFPKKRDGSPLNRFVLDDKKFWLKVPFEGRRATRGECGFGKSLAEISIQPFRKSQTKNEAFHRYIVHHQFTTDRRFQLYGAGRIRAVAVSRRHKKKAGRGDGTRRASVTFR